jgi:hypothetical protein
VRNGWGSQHEKGLDGELRRGPGSEYWRTIGEDARPQTFSVQSVAATAAIPGETPRRAPLVEQTKGPGSLIDTSGAGADDASEAR